MTDNQNNFGLNELYSAELKRISLISERFGDFIKETVKKYPSDKTRKLVMVSELITEIIEKNETPKYGAKQKVEDVYRITEEFVSNKKEVAEREVENGFNLDEVLNPDKNLDLMSLCKELGVTD